MTLPVRFFTETVPIETGGSYDRELIETTHPDGMTKSVRPATDADRAAHPDEYADFINAEVIPTYDELLAEWRVKNPKPTAAQTAENLAKRNAPAEPVAADPVGVAAPVVAPTVRGAR